jgi:putative ABC transport system substrate-binding protein
MKRREFVGALGALAASWPLAARAQRPERTRRLGVFMPFREVDSEAQVRDRALRDGLQALGWSEGRNLQIDYRWTSGGGHLSSGAAELVAMAPDVIFGGGTAATAALQKATQTIPIVFAQVADPIGNGFVATFTRPGGNITGFALYEQAIIVKRLELLKQIAPHVTRVMFIYDPANPNGAAQWSALEAAAPMFGIKVSNAAVRDGAEIERVIEAFGHEPNGGLIVLSSPAINAHRELIRRLATRHRLPDIYSFREFIVGGGLASYGVDVIIVYRQAASYIHRILNGEKPNDLPVQHADKFELVINLKTAKALGLDPPTALLARTDEVIE